jgi:hypothetical protein
VLQGELIFACHTDTRNFCKNSLKIPASPHSDLKGGKKKKTSIQKFPSQHFQLPIFSLSLLSDSTKVASSVLYADFLSLSFSPLDTRWGFHKQSNISDKYISHTCRRCCYLNGLVEIREREKQNKSKKYLFLLVKFDYVVRAIKYTANNNKSDT